MADIKINDIKPAGAELFADSEGFLNELNEDEINNVLGGVKDGNIRIDHNNSSFSFFCG